MAATVKLVLAIAFVLSALSVNAKAMTVAEWIALRDPSYETLVGSATTAFMVANVELRKGRLEKPFFCPPNKLRFTPAVSIQVLEDYVRTDRVAGMMPSSMLVGTILEALKATFPCN